MRKFLLMAVLLPTMMFSISGQTIQALPVSEKISLDGKLSEDAWSRAPENGPFKFPQSIKGAPSAATGFKVLAGDDALYIGITCREPMMDKLKMAATDRGGLVYADDCVEVFIDPTNRRTNYYHFILSANNVQLDDYRIEAGANTNGPYGGFWESAVFRDKDFWTAEIRIPYRTFFYTPSAEFKKEWTFNVCRERQPVFEISSWAQLKTDFHAPALFGTLTGVPAKKTAENLRIDVVSCDSLEQSGDGYTGELQVSIDAAQAAAGKYRLELDSAEFNNYRTEVEIKPGKNTITLKGVKIKSPGKFSVPCRLIRGDQVFGRYYPVYLKYAPVEFVFSEPFYRGCFYPGQRHDKITGTVKINLPLDMLKGCKAAIEVNGAGLAQQQERPVTGNSVNFELDASKMTPGKAVITVKLLSGDKVVVNGSSEVQMLERRSTTMAWIDRGQNLVVDGKPVIMRGWYGGQPVSRNQYFVTQSYLEKYPMPKDNCPSVLEGIWTGLEPERISSQFKSEMTKDIKPSPQVFEAIKKTISENRNKNFWLYYLCDEPECRKISAIYLKYLYDYIKELDPYHPVMIVSREPKSFVDACDIINPHPYINPRLNPDLKRTSMSVVSAQNCWKAAEEAVKDRPVAFFMCPQAFNYSLRDCFADNPDFDETNATLWDGIVHGSKGATPFCYAMYTAGTGMHYAYDSIYESLAALSDMLTAPEPVLPAKVECASGIADIMLKVADGKALLIVVNPDNKPAKITVSADALKQFDKLFTFRDTAIAAPSGGKLEFSLAPLEVKILTSPAMDKGLMPMPRLREKLAADEKAPARSGNILFGRGREIEFTWSPNTYTDILSVPVSLTDGISNVYGWKQAGGQNGGWVEMVFPTFVPKFSRAVIYGYPLEGMEFLIWKEGKWLKLEPASVKKEKYSADLNFGRQYKTIKIKIVLPNAKGNGELYEVELY
ncbi:MAG: sugar-binding protein [Victivallaceae bacterium]|jgi:hypothetical protein